MSLIKKLTERFTQQYVDEKQEKAALEVASAEDIAIAASLERLIESPDYSTLKEVFLKLEKEYISKAQQTDDMKFLQMSKVFLDIENEISMLIEKGKLLKE